MLSPVSFNAICSLEIKSAAVSVDCLINVGTDGGGRAKKLFGDGGVFFCFRKYLIKQDDLRCEVQRFL